MNVEVFDKIFSIDTNIILDNAQNLFEISENGKNLIVMAETVLDEIDSKKSGFNEINFQAREFSRLLLDASIDSKITIDDLTIVQITVNNTIIHIVTTENYQADKTKMALNILNDRKILEITKQYEKCFKKEIIFLSLDVMARTRAISLDIKTESLNLGKDEDELNFIKEFDLHGQEIRNGDSILDFDKDYKQHNFSYIFNQDGNKTLATIKNGLICILEEKELRKQNINPMNNEQLFFSNALLDNHYNIVTVEAKAGSGKTLLAISAAMELIKRKDFQRIVYIRNSIESLEKGEDVGYLSGNDEKFEIYNFPLFDTLAYIANKMLKSSNENKKGKGDAISEERISEKVEELVERFQVETLWPGAMRGRTISNAIIIIDEAQNMSNSTMQLILSRIDNSCKVIVLGSNRQIDNPYINKFTNGLTTLMGACTQEHNEVNLFGIELQKVLRGPITEFAEKVFSKN